MNEYENKVLLDCHVCFARGGHFDWCFNNPEAPREGNLGEVIDGRRSVYGDPVAAFPRVAQIWSGILGTEVSAYDVALCLIGYKVLRTQMTPDYSDNSDDIEGYLDIFRSLVGTDMVHARSVDDYLAQKNGVQL